MAKFVLRRVEPCAVDFINWQTYRTPAKKSLSFEAAIERFDAVDTPMGRIFGPVLCPIRNDLDAIAASLPGFYAMEKGLIYRQHGSTVENHWHPKHLDWVKSHEGHDWINTSSAAPYMYDKDYNRREKLLQKRQAVEEEFSGRNAVDYQGNSWRSMDVYVDFDTEGDIVIACKYDYNEMHEDGDYWLGLHSVPGERTIQDISVLTQMRQFGTDAMPFPLTIKQMIECNIERCINTKITKDTSKLLLKNNEHFHKALSPIVNYVRPVAKTASDAARFGRRVVLDLPDEKTPFVQSDFVATRCTKVEPNCTFVRFGLRYDDTGKVSLANYTSREELGLSDWNQRQPMLLTHWADDAWRFIAVLPVQILAEGANAPAMKTVPALYMIPQVVDRNEVTFSTVSFRGLKIATQEAIWNVDGMSMAISRALMGLTYQIGQKMPKGRINMLDAKTCPVPKHHRVALHGTGIARLVNEDRSVEDYCEERYNFKRAINDGPYEVETRNPHYKINIDRAVDVIDKIFYRLPANKLIPGIPRRPLDKLKSGRIVRI